MESGNKTIKTTQAGIWEASLKLVSWQKHLCSVTLRTSQKIRGEIPGLLRAQGKAAEADGTEHSKVPSGCGIHTWKSAL